MSLHEFEVSQQRSLATVNEESQGTRTSKCAIVHTTNPSCQLTMIVMSNQLRKTFAQPQKLIRQWNFTFCQSRTATEMFRRGKSKRQRTVKLHQGQYTVTFREARKENVDWKHGFVVSHGVEQNVTTILHGFKLKARNFQTTCAHAHTVATHGWPQVTKVVPGLHIDARPTCTVR